MKKKISSIPLIYPIPIVLIGTRYQGKDNFTTIGDIAIMGINPPLLVISLLETHYATQSILFNRSFSVNIPTTDLLEKTDFCGIVSGKDRDKSKLFRVVYGEETQNPLIEECPVSIECEVLKHHIIERRHIFISKVVSTWLNEEYLQGSHTRNFPSLEDLNPIIYGMDNQYYQIGSAIGKGYQEGKSIFNQHLNQEEEKGDQDVVKD